MFVQTLYSALFQLMVIIIIFEIVQLLIERTKNNKFNNK